MRILSSIICAAFAAVVCADETVETAAVTTNLVISSTVTNMLGLSRQAVMGAPGGRVIDRSGTVVSYADAVAQMTTATNLQRIAAATMQGVTNALETLWAVTNQIPEHTDHIALYLPYATLPANLAGEVVSEGSDGTTDWQTVRYSQYLSIAPNRHVKYTYLNVTATVECVWDAWNPSSLVHRCTMTRPTMLRGRLIRSYAHDRMGGPKGFDFGSALVTVDGEPTFTGAWTNRLTGAVHFFRNGANLEGTKEINE